MTLGLMSDVHGNRHALEAVIADGAVQGVKKWWVLGEQVRYEARRPGAPHHPA